LITQTPSPNHRDVPIDLPEAEDNLRQGLVNLERKDYINAKLGCNLAMCCVAPASRSSGARLSAAAAAPQAVLEQSIKYKVATAAYAAVQAIGAQQKRDLQSVSPQLQRRQVLLCIFLCALDLQPRHHVSFVRRTTKLMKRNGNWGLAALYIDGLMAHADKNRGKLEAELDECRANGLRNQPGLVPEEIMRTGRNIKMPLRQAAHYLEQAREMSAETRDAEGLANDSGCLGLVYHLLGVSQKALQYAQEGLSAATSLQTTSAGVESEAAWLLESDLRANLCVVLHSVGDVEGAEESRAAMVSLQQLAQAQARARMGESRAQTRGPLAPRGREAAPQYHEI
jgi:hypothetical protein